MDALPGSVRPAGSGLVGNHGAPIKKWRPDYRNDCFGGHQPRCPDHGLDEGSGGAGFANRAPPGAGGGGGQARDTTAAGGPDPDGTGVAAQGSQTLAWRRPTG